MIFYINGYYYPSELYRLLIFASILVVEFAHNKALLTFVIKQYTLVIDSSGMLVGVWYIALPSICHLSRIQLWSKSPLLQPCINNFYWIFATITFQKLEDANHKLVEKQAILHEANEKLLEVKERLEELQRQYEEKLAHKEEL